MSKASMQSKLIAYLLWLFGKVCLHMLPPPFSLCCFPKHPSHSPLLHCCAGEMKRTLNFKAYSFCLLKFVTEAEDLAMANRKPWVL